MLSSGARALCLHGAVLMFITFISGFLIGAVAVGQLHAGLDDWKLAHMEALTNALLLFAVAGFLDRLGLGAGRARLVVVCLVVMAYCNTLFGVMRGLTGAPGLAFDDSLANNIATAAGMLGVPLGFLAVASIAVAAGRKTAPGSGEKP